MRSRIPIIQARAKEIITELKKNKDVLDLVLDEFAPLKETDDAEAPTTEGKNLTRQVRKSRVKKVLPDSVGQRVTEDVKNARAIKPGDCVQCPNPADANIHHLANTEGYHEFKQAA